MSPASEATYEIGSEIEVSRLGFGSMRLTGTGIWGPPEDPDECRAVLRRAVELGVNFVDTADSYGPYVTEELIGETLTPEDGVTVATKAGLARIGPDVDGAGPRVWPPVGRPEYLRQECEMSLRRLKLEAIDLFQLHRIDPKVPREEQFGLLAELRDEGKVRFVGLSQVSVEEIEAASEIVPVATVQNRHNLAEAADSDVLAHCEEHDIGFIPWAPLGQGSLMRSDGPADEIAERHQVEPTAVLLAWLLHSSPVMLPIPGTSKVAHLEANMGAASLELAPEELTALEAAIAAEAKGKDENGH